MRALLRYFLRGLVVLVPLVLTAYVTYALFQWIDQLLPFSFPGAGLAVALVLTTLIGYLATNFVTRRLFDWMDAGLQRIPFVNMVYRSIKDVTDAFVGDRPRFQQPVRVRLSAASEPYLIGFMTQKEVPFDADEAPYVAVYLPWSYNIGGNLIMVPAELVEPIPAPSARVMTFILSGGLTRGDALMPQPADAPDETPEA